ncbi:hypothetical protein F6A46_09295 [Tenacibaculum finnmarkense genomovar ulcerans]|uniref:hypothetical protein n=1 Tax=Tenacibaculum finnmarkense TaxID=2781243 RepID=UPI00187B95C9|nr:hypothetical protein [Tenacibaculum finnmarkense]MBE7688429.1 hypothetical protein [Tenacibaculum finnmarkense genomovar ulcerans]
MGVIGISKEEQLKNALAHYEKAGSAINEWRSDIPRAIEQFYSVDKSAISLSIQFNDWLIDKCELSEDKTIWSYNSEEYSTETLFDFFANSIVSVEEKAAKWDALGKEIEASYINPETNEEWTDEEIQEKGFDLCSIGEAAATAFGWL